MAARGGAGETGGSQEDSDAEGDPSFDLMETNAKRKEIKRRTKEANPPARPKSKRSAPSPRRFTDPGDAVPARAARPAAAAAVEAVQDDDDEVVELLSPPIAKRNHDNPRDRSKGSEEQRVRAAVLQAAEARARKKPRQPELGAVHEAAAEGGEASAEEEEEDEEEEDDDDDDGEPEAPHPAETGRPVRPEAERGQVSYKNNGVPAAIDTNTITNTLTLTLSVTGENMAFLISIIDAAARKGHALFKDKGPGMRKASSALWTKLASELAELHNVAIVADTLKKKVWKGQAGSQSFSSFMQQARPHYRPPTGESGRASPVGEVLAACFKLLENLDRATDEMKGEQDAKAEKAKRTEEGEKEMNERINPEGGKGGRRSKKAKSTQSRSPAAVFTALGMGNLVQRAWKAMTDYELDFFTVHQCPTPRDDVDVTQETVPGWVYKDATKEWCPHPHSNPYPYPDPDPDPDPDPTRCKVDRHMVEEYSLMLDEGDGDWSDHHKLYMDWVKTQPATTKTKLALMLNEVHSVPGADATSEISEVANAMERAAQSNAAAVKEAALARERASTHKEDLRAQQKKSDLDERSEARKASDAEKAAGREAAAAATSSLHSLIADVAKQLPSILHPQAAAAAAAAAAPPRPGGAGPSSSSEVREPLYYESLEALLTTAGVDKQAMPKFAAESYGWPEVRSAFCSGEQSLMDDLKEIGITLGDRRRIVNALDRAKHL